MDNVLRIPRGWVVVFLALLSWAFVALIVSPAFAQDVIVTAPNEVVLNWGDFISILLGNIADPQSVAWTFVAGAIGWVVLKLPAPLQFAFKLFQVNQLLNAAITAAINSTKDATAGKSLTVNVGGEVLAKAIQYAIDNGQAQLIEWMGGRKGVEAKVIARLPLVPSASGSELIKAAKEAPKSLLE